MAEGSAEGGSKEGGSPDGTGGSVDGSQGGGQIFDISTGTQATGPDPKPPQSN